MIDYNISKEEVIKRIIDKNKEIEGKIENKKDTGSFYTNLELSIYMIEEMIKNSSKDFISNIENKTFLEPCLGVGSFVFAYLINIDKLNLGQDIIKKIINNIYVCEINDIAVEEYKKLFTQFVYSFFYIELDEDYFTNRIANGLLYNMDVKDFRYIDIQNVFPEIMARGGFDIVATNPPYKNLKAEKNKYKSIVEYENDKNIYEKISKVTPKLFKYSSEGVLNLYKLFVEDIICKYSSKDAKIVLLIPNTILSDKTCKKIRTHILQNYQIISINVIQENNNFVNAQQALCTMLIDKSQKTDIIKINNNFCTEKNKYTYVALKDILNNNTENAIFTLDEKEYNLLNKLNKFQKIKDLDFIINKRGELDLTLDKKYIGNYKEYKLIRGRDIGFYELNEGNEYVSRDFINKCSKKEFINQERIACQQIANIHKKRRINYTIVPRNYVLGNSCNFISILKNKYDIDLYYMLGLLNSDIINWYFKLTSSNNHINNYEIDNFPVPVNYKNKNKISKLVKKYIQNQKNEDILKEINQLIYESFEIEENEETDINKSNDIINKYYSDIKKIIPEITLGDAENIISSKSSIETYLTAQNIVLDKFNKKVCETITEKYKKINKNQVLNHITFKLSDLDLEMIKNVPPGGNWQNIPKETVEKSKRLSRITKTGGRTTLYGRIDYNKPSYTITTYFNRPGNGTYVHPNIDRVISVREASRLQSFKDDYYFYGNKTDLLKQVGNAVPPILAREIGKSIIEKTGCNKSIDLFCGAGGMTSGFKDAGIKSILGNDFNESACITFKANNPEIKVICDDITEQNVKNKIIEIGKEYNVDIVCGGPPCQGFSYAGKRFIDDPRNQLFKDFVEIVRNIRPKIVVMENVEGILTFDKGNVYRQINELYKKMGYKIEGRVLLASNYGVPQKRKRVIIICVRDDIDMLPEELFPIPTTKNEKEQITAFDAISDLENIECNENAVYSNVKTNNYIRTLKNIYKNVKKIVNNNINEQLSLF